MMAEEIRLPDDLSQRCQQLLMQFPYFENSDNLRSLFSVEGLYEYKKRIPQEDNKELLVEQTISLLLKERFDRSEPLILILLRQLFPFETPEPGTKLYKELERLYIDLHVFFCQESAKNYPGELNPQEAAEFACLILECPSMRLEETRDTVWQKLDLPGNPNATGVAVADILSMIRASSSLDMIERLADMIYQHEQGSPAWEKIDTFVCGRTKKPISYTRREELKAILQELQELKKIQTPQESDMDWVWTEAYRRSLPDEWEKWDEKSLNDILEKLARKPIPSINNQPNVHPMLRFGYWLARYAEKKNHPEIAEKLKKWIKDRAKKLGISDKKIEDLYEELPTSRGSAQYYLAIALHPVGRKYQVEAWLLDESYQIDNEVSGYHKKMSKTLEEITDVVNELLNECETYFGKLVKEEKRTGILTLEFFLPNELLDHDFDQRIHDNGFIQEKYGDKYIVVVRSWKRANSPHMLNDWYKRWEYFVGMKEGRLPVNGQEPERYLWYCEEKKSPADFLYSLRNSKTAYVLMNCAPQNDTGMFNAIIGAGVPVALWPRQDLPDADTESLRPSAPEELEKLGEAIRIYRSSARYDRQLGYHLSLMLDDPDRPLPSNDRARASSPK
jgi:hypothetical protein